MANTNIFKHADYRIFFPFFSFTVQRPFVGGETVTNIKHETHETGLILNDAVRAVAKTMALTNNSTTNQSFGNNPEASDCVVCGDRATGKFVLNRSNFRY